MKMNKITKKVIHWAPRTLSALLVLFWVFFVFASHGLSIVTLIESVVWIVVLAATIIAWKREEIGAAIFIILGLLYVGLTWTKADWVIDLIVSVPFILTGILFWVSAVMEKK